MNSLRYGFFVAIYLSGILIGETYTSDVIAYSKQASNEKNLEKVKKVKPAPVNKPVKKKRRMRIV